MTQEDKRKLQLIARWFIDRAISGAILIVLVKGIVVAGAAVFREAAPFIARAL